MHLRRLISALSVGAVVASSIVAAAPKKADKKKKAPAAAKGDKGSAGSAGSAATPATGSAATPPTGSAAGSAGSADEGPPKDIEGREENPANPKGTETEEPPTAAPPPKPTGYPIELAKRPILLLKGMGEASISPHTEFSDFMFVDRLRVRYGITSKIQVGLTYAYGAVYNQALISGTTKTYDFHAGKAVGIDFQYLLTDFLAVKLGVPIYVDPVAVSLQLGAPMKFHITDKFAIGGLDDLLNIKLSKFPVSYECVAYGAYGCGELDNARAASQESVGGTQSKGDLNISAYGIYQLQPQLALYGRLALRFEDFSQNRDTSGYGGIYTALRAGAEYAVMKFLDIGGDLGFDSLAKAGTFGIGLHVVGRI